MCKIFLAALAGFVLASPAFGQVRQSGNVTARHAACWTTTGVIQDCGTAAVPYASSVGTVGQGETICANSAAVSGPYNRLCLSANTSSAAQITLQNFGGATAQDLQFNLNGTIVTLPSGGGTFVVQNPPFVANHVPSYVSSGGVLQDSGLGVTSGAVTTGQWTATPVALLYGGTGSTSAAGARSNLGLGTMAIQNAVSVSITGGAITGMPTPTASTDVAIKSYVDALAAGLTFKTAVRLGTVAVLSPAPTYSNGTAGVNATLTAVSNLALSIDGTLAVANDRVLIKNQVATTGCTVANAGCQNGVYTVTATGDGSNPYVLTRATDFDTSAEMLAGSYFLVTAGSTLSGSSWTLQTTVATVGTTPATFVQFAAAGVTSLGGAVGAVTLGSGISIPGNVLTFTLPTQAAYTVTCNNTGGTLAPTGCASAVTLQPSISITGSNSAANTAMFLSATSTGFVTTSSAPTGAGVITAPFVVRNYDSAGPTGTSADCGSGAAATWKNCGYGAVEVYHNFGTGDGTRTALGVTMYQSVATSTGGGLFYTGIFSNVNAGVGDGGTLGNSLGNYFGYAGIVSAPSTSNFIGSIIGMELDTVAAAGRTLGNKIGIQIISGSGGGPTDLSHGTNLDVAYSIGAATSGDVGFTYGLQVGQPGFIWPISTTGTIIGTGANVLSLISANGVDFSAVTFTGCAFKSAGFCVNGSGLAQGVGLRAQSNFASIVLDDTAGTSTAGGLVRLAGSGSGNVVAWQSNTAVAGDFGSAVTVFSVTATALRYDNAQTGTPVAALCLDASNNIIKKVGASC